MEKIIEAAKTIKARLEAKVGSAIEVRVSCFDDDPIDVQLHNVELPGMKPEVYGQCIHLRAVCDGVRYSTVVSPSNERYAYWMSVVEAANGEQ